MYVRVCHVIRRALPSSSVSEVLSSILLSASQQLAASQPTQAAQPTSQPAIPLGNFSLGTFAWHVSLGKLRLETFA